MTNQIQGEILFAGWDEMEGEWCYTPWMPVRGDFGTFGVEVLHNEGTVPLVWNVETREAEEVGAIPVAVFTADQAGAGVAQSDVAAQQWVRYRFGTGGTASTSTFVVLRALAPSWQVDR